MEFDAYIRDVKSQLYCNASDYARNNYITYDYTDCDVDSNLDYFKKCMNSGLSAYKALLFFSDYLN